MNVSVAAEKLASTQRILDAARSLAARGGAGALSVGDVAQAAGVSKALVHYHFRDKDSMLAHLVRQVGDDLLAREELALGATNRAAPLDAYWAWLERELSIGDVQVLVALAPGASPTVATVLRDVALARRGIAARHIDLTFEYLGLRPRVSADLISETMMAFVNGLACTQNDGSTTDARSAFDVLWLALLSLAD